MQGSMPIHLNAHRKIIPIQARLLYFPWVSNLLITRLLPAHKTIFHTMVLYNLPGMDLIAITYLISWLLMIAIPIVLGIYLTRKFHFRWRLWLIGGSIFIISQIFHLPFNNYVLNPILVTLQHSITGAMGVLVIALLLGLSSGVFEECARYGMFRWWLKDQRTWRSAVLAGAGHGGTESIILGVYLMWIYINLFLVRHADLSKMGLTPDQLNIMQQQITAYWSVSWYNSLLPLVERIFTIPFHIMASVMVLQVFTRRPGKQQFGWLGLAILMHTIMNASSVFVASQWNVYISEAVLGGLAIIDIIIIFALRQPEPPESPTIQAPSKPPIFPPLPLEETSENLEKTRYQ